MIKQSIKCWNCDEEIDIKEMFCLSCKSLQQPSQTDHFTRLGMPKDFSIGIKNLEVEYFALQRKLHPDLFINKSDKERKFSMQYTADINEAYEALKSPLKRAEYILFLDGIIVYGDKATVKPSQELLMESLEAREALENATNPKELRNISIENAEKRIACIEDIKNNLTDGNSEQAAQNTIRLKYLEKLAEEIKQKT